MKKAAFYQIQDGDTGAQVAQGLQGNFEALQLIVELSTVRRTITVFSPNPI